MSRSRGRPASCSLSPPSPPPPPPPRFAATVAAAAKVVVPLHPPRRGRGSGPPRRSRREPESLSHSACKHARPPLWCAERACALWSVPSGVGPLVCALCPCLTPRILFIPPLGRPRAVGSSATPSSGSPTPCGRPARSSGATTSTCASSATAASAVTFRPSSTTSKRAPPTRAARKPKEPCRHGWRLPEWCSVAVVGTLSTELWSSSRARPYLYKKCASAYDRGTKGDLMEVLRLVWLDLLLALAAFPNVLGALGLGFCQLSRALEVP